MGREYVSEQGEVAIFDYCIDNFFFNMDYICKLCSFSSQHDLDLADIDRFSSMITFLKEWKYFQYDPRIVSFPYGSERVFTGTSSGPIRQELKLPQFSSATIPKDAKLAGEANSFTSDFVLYAGGSVCALDWCPRADDKAVSAITCEYLAVSAHPPGSHYHKMGASLKGRGAIQIWCLVTTTEPVELSKPPYRVVKRRAKETLIVKDGVENDKQKLLAMFKRRGRPKKLSLMDETNGTHVAKQKNIGRPRKKPRDEKDTCPKVAKKRSRPRKYAQCSKRRLKDKQSIHKPDVVAAESSIVEYVTSSECRIVEPNSTETECNAEKKLARSVCCPTKMLLPKLVFCLAHYGKVAWDIKWKPFATSSTARMGYLAVLLGDGSLEVWEVPIPSTVQRIYSLNHGRGEGTDPRFLKLKAIFRCSKLTVGNRQSIPLTLEWSTSPPGDMILAGCHDGMVALWKFAIHTTCEDSRPLLVFTADSSPIRSLAWAPHDSENPEDTNLFVVAGSEGLKFWDIRDPYHSLWEVNPAHRAVVSVDWLKDPRCILMTVEDGTVRIFSLPKGANDLPVTGMLLPRKQFEGIFIYTMSVFAIWSIHTSLTGLAAYCVTDGSVVVFQLTERFLEPNPTRNQTPYFLCDCFKDGGILELGPPFRNNVISNLPLKPIKGPSRYFMGDDKALVSATNPPPNRDDENNVDVGMLPKVDDSCDNTFPSKLVALRKVRWNKNKGTERWLCYGGAAGIIRFQKISFDS